MKKIFSIFFVALFAWSVQAQSPNSFIGNIDFSIKGADNVDMSVSTKEWQTAMNVKAKNGENVVMIFDHKKDNVTILTNDGPNGKYAIVTSMKNIPMAQIEEKVDKNNDVKIEKTNETKVILGYECQKYIITSEDGVAETWLTDKITFNPFESLSKMGNKMNTSITNSYKDKLNGLAMHTIFKDNKGKETEIKVTAIDNKPNEKLFSTAGYQIMDMSSFGR